MKGVAIIHRKSPKNPFISFQVTLTAYTHIVTQTGENISSFNFVGGGNDHRSQVLIQAG